MLKLFLGLVIILATCAGAREEVIKTTTREVKGARLTVVHFAADWCGICVAMEPAMDRLRSKYSSQVSMVSINVDSENTPEIKRYGKLAGRIPFTAWLDASGNVLDQQAGSLSAEQLFQRTRKALMRAR